MENLYKINGGVSAVAPRSILTMMPVGYPAGTKVYWQGTIMYEMVNKISDADIRVFMCALKAFTDNDYDKITKSKDYNDIQCGKISAGHSTSFNVSVKELSLVAHNERSRPEKVVKSLSNIAGLQIHLLNEKLASKGFAVLVTGAVLSEDKKTIEVSINTRFLVDMAKNLVQYNFVKMLSFKGLDQRLYMVMQARKFSSGKGKYGYHCINDDDLRIALNSDSKNSKYAIAKSFKNIGINFVLGRGRWDYPAKNLNIFK